MILICVAICSTPINAATKARYTCDTIRVSGKYSDTKSQNRYKKIIRTYKELTRLKKYIRKNYKYPKKYLKKLNKYKKSYFKKKALVFATENVDVNIYSYKLISATIENKKINLNIEKKCTLKEGQSAACVVRYSARTYILNVKKSKLKDVNKIRIIHNEVMNAEETSAMSVDE